MIIIIIIVMMIMMMIMMIIIIIIIYVMELGHLLTCSGLTYPEVSSKVMIPSASWKIVFHYPG